MGRDWPAVTATVDLVLPPILDLGWEAETDFVLDEGLPFALLGYEGFLNLWAVAEVCVVWLADVAFCDQRKSR